jgi:tryptophanyl-tRNA synthetase
MRTLTGLQPSGTLHIGNYFGSIMQAKTTFKHADEKFMFVADLHAITSVLDAEKLKSSRIEIVQDYLACGFDPNDINIYQQSDIPEHCELMWILSNIAPMGLLERAHSYKDKIAKGKQANVGLFTYPILMAADILLYQVDQVPVGKDQKQHVEITRDLAIKFNNTFGETFTIPDVVIAEEVAVVPGTDGAKMSKSYGNTIPLFTDEATAKKAIMSITTDSKGKDDPKDPDSCMIFQINKLFLNDAEREALSADYRGGLPYGDAKKRLLQDYLTHMQPLWEARSGITEDYARDVLIEGAKKVRSIAQATMENVKERVGLR